MVQRQGDETCAECGEILPHGITHQHRRSGMVPAQVGGKLVMLDSGKAKRKSVIRCGDTLFRASKAQVQKALVIGLSNDGVTREVCSRVGMTRLDDVSVDLDFTESTAASCQEQLSRILMAE